MAEATETNEENVCEEQREYDVKKQFSVFPGHHFNMFPYQTAANVPRQCINQKFTSFTVSLLKSSSTTANALTYVSSGRYVLVTYKKCVWKLELDFISPELKEKIIVSVNECNIKGIF